MRRSINRHAFAAFSITLLFIVAATASAENERLNTLLRAAAALAGAGAGLREDFEAPAVPNAATYRTGQILRTRGASWQVEQGSVDLVNTQVRKEIAAWDGKQSLELTGSPEAGVLSTQAATRVGQTYTVTVHYARSNALGRTVARATIDVQGSNGGTRLHADLAHDPAQLAFAAQQTYIGTFVADSARSTLRLSSLNAGTAGMTVDGISLAPSTASEIAARDAAAAPAVAPSAQPIARLQREDRTAFLARCKRETIAQYPSAAPQADSICRSKWDAIEASASIVDTLFTAAPAVGARFDAAATRRALTTVRWRARADQGQQASGQLDGLSVGIITAPAAGVAISWTADGKPIPFEVEEALKVRGATLSMIGCLEYGAAEGSRVYRINAPGKAAFSISEYRRSAAVASQSSTYSLSADFSGKLPTLASLRRDGSEWQPACAQ